MTGSRGGAARRASWDDVGGHQYGTTTAVDPDDKRTGPALRTGGGGDTDHSGTPGAAAAGDAAPDGGAGACRRDAACSARPCTASCVAAPPPSSYPCHQRRGLTSGAFSGLGAPSKHRRHHHRLSQSPPSRRPCAFGSPLPPPPPSASSRCCPRSECPTPSWPTSPRSRASSRPATPLTTPPAPAGPATPTAPDPPSTASARRRGCGATPARERMGAWWRSWPCCRSRSLRWGRFPSPPPSSPGGGDVPVRATSPPLTGPPARRP
mmetsp:Transcript_27863/g.59204  ORF Transcript_27863/g.59204 Transcript_27863/m.59204 type:complete len:265 (-) Transcript_27863:2294-3088(-)